jgi:hypothetical protein
MEDEAWISVWVPFENPHFQRDALAHFHDFIHALGIPLVEQDLGYFEGANVGTDRITLSFTLHSDVEAQRAIAAVMDCLKSSEHAREAIAAHAGFVTREGKRSRFDQAIWPPGFVGKLPR